MVIYALDEVKLQVVQFVTQKHEITDHSPPHLN